MLVKSTRSVCPSCLRSIPASVIERAGKVFLEKTCPEHGAFEVLLAGSARHYYRPQAQPVAGGCCGGGKCGPTGSHSCSLMVEIIDRCNLTCPTCYAGSSPQLEARMGLEQFRELLQTALAQGKQGTDLLQLSGGEPTLHPQLFAFLDTAIELGFRKTYINSNGIRLSDPTLVERLADHGDKVGVYLQWDGLQAKTHESLRGTDLTRAKQQALDRLEERGVDTVPVMTLIPGVNDHEIGSLLRAIWKRPFLSRMMIQPAMGSGRALTLEGRHRATLSDVIQAICDQTGVFAEEDFSPIPCSDPNCFSLALAWRRGEKLVPLTRCFPPYQSWSDPAVQSLISQVTESFDRPESLWKVLDWIVGSPLLQSMEEEMVDHLLDAALAARSSQPGASYGDLFAIGIKPFMDVWTYDQDRIDRCCTHVMTSAGEVYSFCQYNALERGRTSL